MKIVLIDGVETYQCMGVPSIFLGVPVEVPEEIAEHLLGQRCPTGPMFIPSKDFAPQRVRIRLVDWQRTYRTPEAYADGPRPVEVSASIAPYLLRLRRDGAALFEEVS